MKGPNDASSFGKLGTPWLAKFIIEQTISCTEQTLDGMHPSGTQSIWRNLVREEKSQLRLLVEEIQYVDHPPRHETPKLVRPYR